ncbi:unnamed protein product [Symbiodinium microadriaticum]|nr:unnamed protein product [Symbiodinium microadriaticum]
MEETYRLSSGVSKRQLLIGTSTDTDKKSSNLALSSGMDVFLGKPFTPSDIWLFVSVATDGASSDRGGGGGNEGSVVEQKEGSDVSIGSGSFISLPLSGFTDAETLHLRDADQVEEVNDEGN